MTKQKPKRVVNRRAVSRYLAVLDELIEAKKRSNVTLTVIASMIDIEYIRLDKYMRKERNVSSEEIAKKMYATAKILNDLVDIGDLPLGDEINKRNRTEVALGVIENYLTGRK